MFSVSIVFSGLQKPDTTGSCVHSLAQRVRAFLHALFPFFSITNNHVYPDTGESSIENLV
jgi:hypothetical protein